MATILPEGLYNAKTYTITWDENEPGFYVITEDDQEIAWLKQVRYFGLGTDTPGTNEDKVVIDNWCIREKLQDYQYEYSISEIEYKTPIFEKNLARYQVPAYHINGKKMYGVGEANYSEHSDRFNFATRPKGDLYLTTNETVPVLNATNVLEFGWGDVNTRDLEENFSLSDDLDNISQPFTSPRYGFYNQVLDSVTPSTNPGTLSMFGKLSLNNQYCVVKFYERNNPDVFGYTAIGAEYGFDDNIELTLNNNEKISVGYYRSPHDYKNQAVSLIVGVKAKELDWTYGETTFVHPGETIRFTLRNSANAVAVRLIYAGGLDGGVVISDGGSYEGKIKVSTDRYIDAIITAHCPSTENAWIEIYAKSDNEKGGNVTMEQMIPIIHPNYKKYDFVVLPYLNPYDKCNNCKAVLDDVGKYTTCPYCGSSNIIKFK